METCSYFFDALSIHAKIGISGPGGRPYVDNPRIGEIEYRLIHEAHPLGSKFHMHAGGASGYDSTAVNSFYHPFNRLNSQSFIGRIGDGRNVVALIRVHAADAVGAMGAGCQASIVRFVLHEFAACTPHRDETR
jgi:hypothetical protein